MLLPSPYLPAVNRTHPANIGLRWNFVADKSLLPRDLIKGHPATIGGGGTAPTVLTDPFIGNCLNVGNANVTIKWPTTYNIGDAQTVTAALVCIPIAVSGSFLIHFSNATDAGLDFLYNTTFQVQNRGGGSNYDSGISLTSGAPYLLVFTQFASSSGFNGWFMVVRLDTGQTTLAQSALVTTGQAASDGGVTLANYEGGGNGASAKYAAGLYSKSFTPPAALRAWAQDPRGPWRRQPAPLFAFNSSGGTTFNQSCLASSSALATLSRADAKPVAASSATIASLVRGMAKAVAASSVDVASSTRQTGKPFASSSAAVASDVRQTGKPLSVSSASVASASALKVALVAAQATSAAVASLLRSVGKSVSASSSVIASKTLQTGKVLTASVAAIASRLVQVGKPLAAGSSAIASRSSQTGKAFSANTASVASASTVKVKLVSVQAVSAAVASLARSIGKPLQAGSAPVGTIVRGVQLVRRVAAAPLASLARGMARSFQATSVAIASLIIGGGSNFLPAGPFIAGILRRRRGRAAVARTNSAAAARRSGDPASER